MRILAVALSTALVLPGCTEVRPSADAPDSLGREAVLRTVSASPGADDVTTWRRAEDEIWLMDDRTVWGLNSHLHRWERNRQFIRQTRDAGFALIRHTVRWRSVEVREGELLPVNPDRHLHNPMDNLALNLERMEEAGIEPMIVLHTAPEDIWPVGDRNRAEFDRRFAVFLREIARAFPRVRLWTIWNEVDAGWWGDAWAAGAGGESFPYDRYEQGRNYARTLKVLYPALREANPDAFLVMSPLTGREHFVRGDDGSVPDPSRLSWRFLEGLYDAGGDCCYDFFAIHSYGWPGERDGPMRKLASAWRVLARHGDADRPALLTETGWGGYHTVQRSGGFPHERGLDDAEVFDREQVDYYRALVEEHDGEFEMIFPYNLYTRGGNPPEGTTVPEPRDYNLSLLRVDEETPRPALEWFAAQNLSGWAREAEARSVSVEIRLPDADPVGVAFERTGDRVRLEAVEVGTIYPTRVPLRPRARSGR